MAKFNVGDKVQMTADTYAVNRGARSCVGVVTRAQSQKLHDHFRLRREGYKRDETWHESAWELRGTPDSGTQAAKSREADDSNNDGVESSSQPLP